MAWKGHQNVGDGWTGWVEVTDLSIQRVDGEIVGKSRHRFSARNDGNQEGNFAVTYNLVLQSWIGQDDGDSDDDNNWGFFEDDKQTHHKPTAAGATVGHSILEDDDNMPHVRTASRSGPGGRPYRVVAYTQVDPQHPITGDPEKVELKKVVDL